NPFNDGTKTLVGGFIEYKKLDSPPPAAPQPDSANAYIANPTQPTTAYSGADAATVNKANTGGNHTQIGGMTFDKRFLMVSGLALGAAVVLKVFK
uniref:hypothetical protein n=1 Tax=Streptomyces sp. B29(2018) TaxID=2485016 RepID=UPI0013E33E53